nr:ATP-binding protein [Afifella sp. IM 167]
MPAWIADRLTTYEPEKDRGRTAVLHGDVEGEDPGQSQPADDAAPSEEKSSVEASEEKGPQDTSEQSDDLSAEARDTAAPAGAPDAETQAGEGQESEEPQWTAPVVPLNAGPDDAATSDATADNATAADSAKDDAATDDIESDEAFSDGDATGDAPGGGIGAEETPAGDETHPHDTLPAETVLDEPPAEESPPEEELSAAQQAGEGTDDGGEAAGDDHAGDAAEREEPKPEEAGRREPSPVMHAALPPAARDENGRTATRSQPLPPVSVRFLWQTDAAHRLLFVSQGLTQLVGRHAEIVGEKWQDAADRLRLDPSGRIQKAFAARDTWSGLTAWWPSQNGETRIPAELTALPVFDAERTFQGFRGFGVLRPAEALKAEAFDLRYPPAEEDAMPGEPPDEPETEDNVVPFRADLERLPEFSRLSQQEKRAFETIASALGARISDLTPSTGTPQDERRAMPDPSEAQEPSPEEEAASSIERMLPDAPGEDESGADALAEEAPVAPEPEVPVLREEAAPAAEARPALAPAPVLAAKVSELQAIVDTALDGVVVLDLEGFIESVNRSAEALFGIEEEDVVGEAFTVLLEEESHEMAEAYLESLRTAGIKSLINEGREVLGRTPGGPIALFMTFGHVGTPERPRFCAVLRDITQWKETEARLREARSEAERASTQKSDFLARISHEIRTPLNAIIGFAEVMVEERFGPIENQRYREYLRDIRSSSEHVVSLVNDLLDISRVEAGKLDLDFVAVDVNAVARECVGLMQPQAGGQQVIIRTSFAPDLPPVVADERTMRQIFLNLLSNSVKYTGAGGQVIVSTRLEETGELVLRVRDNGGGMSETDLAKVMEPFRQVVSSAIGSGTGSGLGLPLTKALVEANRAEFTLRSARGEGTIAEIAFPATRVLSE